jgi:ABC-type transporter Mla subunit MlaD
MPQHARNEIKAGVFILLAFAMLCAGVYVVADFGTILRPKKLYYFSFDKVEGLKIADDVMYAGIKCGTVASIKFLECPEKDSMGEAKTRVLVTARIDGDVPVRDKDKPKVTRGLTGNVFMDIVPYQRAAAGESLGNLVVPSPDNVLFGYHYPSFEELAERANSVMVTVQAELARVDRTLQNVEEAAANAKDISVRARDMVQRSEPHIDQIVQNVDKTADRVQTLTAKLEPDVLKMVQDARQTVADTRAKINEMLPKATDIMDKIDNSATNVRDLIAANRPKIDATVTDVHETVAEARKTLTDAHEVIIANRDNIDGTIEELRQGSARLNIAMEDIRRNPWKLLNRNIQADAYTQNIYDASMSFAEGARALSIASGNFQAMLSRPETQEQDVKAAAEKINTLVGEMAKLQQLLYEAMKARPK